MAYTTAQLVSAYTNANLGKTPDAATTLTLDAYATQSQTGGISDATALNNTLKLLNGTTAVAVETYQFFTGRAPSAAGLDYLVDSTTNTTDLNDAYYAKFAQENRFINFSINLATGAGEGAANFAALYANTATSTVTYAQTVATAYDKIIGNAVATAAGVDVAAAVAYLSRQANIDYLTAFVKANTPFTAAADIDLAVKAALIGEILSAATTSGIGGYAAGTTALLADLSDGVLSTDAPTGVNILTSYPGTGTVGTTFNLTASIDTVTGTNANDTFNGIATATAGSATVNLLDSVDGGGGNDTLNLSNAGAAADLDVSNLTVKNIENVNLTSVTGLAGGVADFSAWTGLTAANVAVAAPAAAQAVTVGASTNVAFTVAKAGANNVSVQGGANVTSTTTGLTTGTVTVGSTTAPTGTVIVNATGVYADGANSNFGAISVKGGSTVTVTEATGITAAQSTAAVSDTTNFTVNQGAITVTGTAATKTVTVNQAAVATQTAATVETAAITVNTGLVAGQSVTIGGLTFTSTAGSTQGQVIAAFENLAANATTGPGAGGTYSGTFGNYTTGAVAGVVITATGAIAGNLANVTSSDATIAGVAVTAGVNGIIGVTTGAVAITDVNAASGTTAGTITTVSIANAAAATITGNAVSTLSLTDATATLTANTANTALSKALALTVSGTTALTDTNGELASVNVNATATSTLTLVDTGLTALTVSGAKGLTLGSPNALTSLKTVTVTGAGGLTANLSGAANAAAVTTVDTTGSTGINTISIDASGTAKTAYAGGAGIDVVTLVNGLPTGGSISLGAGNDRLLGTTALAVSATSVIDGGTGTDAVASTLINNGNAAQFKGFEVLNLAETAGTFDVSLLTGSTITSLELNGGTGGGTYANVGLAQGLSVTGTGSGLTTLAFATAAVAGTSDAYSIGFNAVTTGTTAAPATVAAGQVAVAGIENLTVTSGAAAGVVVNTITLTDADAKTLTVTGSSAATISFNAFGSVAGGLTGVATIDASAATGVITLSTAGLVVNAAGVAIKGGAGADVITVTAGYDTVITGGAGKDTVNVSANVSALNLGQPTIAAHTTITDFAIGSGDKIVFADKGIETFTSTKVDVSLANDLQAALDLAAAGNGSVNGLVKWFQYGGATYIVEDLTAGATFAATDIVVKLTGTVDLSTATLTSTGAAALTF